MYSILLRKTPLSTGCGREKNQLYIVIRFDNVRDITVSAVVKDETRQWVDCYSSYVQALKLLCVFRVIKEFSVTPIMQVRWGGNGKWPCAFTGGTIGANTFLNRKLMKLNRADIIAVYRMLFQWAYGPKFRSSVVSTEILGFKADALWYNLMNSKKCLSKMLFRGVNKFWTQVIKLIWFRLMTGCGINRRWENCVWSDGGVLLCYHWGDLRQPTERRQRRVRPRAQGVHDSEEWSPPRYSTTKPLCWLWRVCRVVSPRDSIGCDHCVVKPSSAQRAPGQGINQWPYWKL